MKRDRNETLIHLQQWHEGNQDGLNALLERHLPWIQEQVRKRITPKLRKKAETLDFVQDALVQFLRFSPRFIINSAAEFRALLLKIAENGLHNKYHWFMARRREMARERPLPTDTVLSLDPPADAVTTPSRSAEQHEREAWIRLGMEFLEPDDREVLVLRQWDHKSFEEIGAHFNTTAKAAWMRHNRAVKRLSSLITALRSGKLTRLLGECVSGEGAHDTE